MKEQLIFHQITLRATDDARPATFILFISPKFASPRIINLVRVTEIVISISRLISTAKSKLMQAFIVDHVISQSPAPLRFYPSLYIYYDVSLWLILVRRLVI